MTLDLHTVFECLENTAWSSDDLHTCANAAGDLDIGFAGYLLKPVTQRDLLDCLATALASRAESWHMKSQPIITRHALRSQRAQHQQRLGVTLAVAALVGKGSASGAAFAG